MKRLALILTLVAVVLVGGCGGHDQPRSSFLDRYVELCKHTLPLIKFVAKALDLAVRLEAPEARVTS